MDFAGQPKGWDPFRDSGTYTVGRAVCLGADAVVTHGMVMMTTHDSAAIKHPEHIVRHTRKADIKERLSPRCARISDGDFI